MPRGHTVPVLWVCLFVGFLGTTACDEGPAGLQEEGQEPGEFTGYWDGELWVGEGFGEMEGDSLILIGRREHPDHDYPELISIKFGFDPDRPGRYRVPEMGRALLAQLTSIDAGHLTTASGTVDVVMVHGGARAVGTVSLVGDDEEHRWHFSGGFFDVPVEVVPED